MADVWKPKDAKVIAQWIDAVDSYGRGLNDWELQFMRDVRKFPTKGWALSQKQEEILERIYADKTP